MEENVEFGSDVLALVARIDDIIEYIILRSFGCWQRQTMANYVSVF
jgi:hypothetical protein